MPGRTANNVVFIVNIKGIFHHQDFSKYCLLSWNYWAKKNNAALFVLQEPFSKAPRCIPHFQKYFAFSVLSEQGIDAEQVAIVDVDTMIHWNCPNFFELRPAENICVVLDDEQPRWVAQSLEVYQSLLPETKVNWWEYFSSGFVLLGREHAGLLSDFADFYFRDQPRIHEIYAEHHLWVGFDQTLFNLFVRKKAIPIAYLSKIFNFGQMARKEVLEERMFLDYAYIWHFNGIEHSKRERYMAETWEAVKQNYQDLAG